MALCTVWTAEVWYRYVKEMFYYTQERSNQCMNYRNINKFIEMLGIKRWISCSMGWSILVFTSSKTVNCIMSSTWRYNINASMKSRLLLRACTNSQLYVLVDVHILGWTKSNIELGNFRKRIQKKCIIGMVLNHIHIFSLRLLEYKINMTVVNWIKK